MRNLLVIFTVLFSLPFGGLAIAGDGAGDKMMGEKGEVVYDRSGEVGNVGTSEGLDKLL